jgi:hypothetical protein
MWEPAFFAELEMTRNLAQACRAAGVSVQKIYQRRGKNADFAERVDALLNGQKYTRDAQDRLVALKEPPDWEPIEELFLVTLSQTLNAAAACRTVGVSYEDFARRRKRDAVFAERVGLAISKACDELEGSVFQRALGESDGLAIALLRTYRPDLYSREFRPLGDGGEEKRSRQAYLANLSDEDRAQLRTILQKAQAQPPAIGANDAVAPGKHVGSNDAANSA